MNSGRDSKDDAMRVVLTEGQSHHLHDTAGINNITAIRAALSSYQANQNKPNKKRKPEQTAAGNTHAAHDEKDNAKADNFDMELTTASTKPTIPTVILTIPTWWVKWYDIPGIDKLPNVLQYLVLAYADYLPEEKVIYQYPNPNTISRAPFFTRYISQIQYRLEQAANDLLSDGNIDQGLALIELNTDVINIETQGRDRFGRLIQGKTLLQMAGMNGHFNNREKKAEEKKDHGAVELFAQAAGLTHNEVATQLFPVLFSDEAINENNARKNRVLSVVKEFAETILKRKADLPKSLNTIEKFKAAQAIYKSEFDKLRKDIIRIVSNEVIKCGYILDSHIIVEFDKWFTDNITRFGGDCLISDLIWTGGYGSLQYASAAPDAHIHRHGIGPVVDSGEIPARTLKNSDGSSHFSADSRLGLDFCVGYYARGLTPSRRGGGAHGGPIGKLMSSKSSSVAKFMQRLSPQSKAGCTIM